MAALEITWYGHSCVMLREGGVRVLVDPFFEGNPGAPDWRTVPAPDIIAVTHDHHDHLGQTLEIFGATGCTIACIADLAGFFAGKGVPRSAIANFGMGWNMGGTVEEKGVAMTMVRAYHSCAVGAPAGFVFRFPGGHTVYHAGDTDEFSDMALIGDRFPIDVALLPIGGVFTMDAEGAARSARRLRPACVVPIHYASFPVLAQSAEPFVRAMGEALPGCRVFVPGRGDALSID